MTFDPNIKPSLIRLSKEIQLHEKMVRHNLLPSCVNCEHWQKKPEVCGFYGARPPAEVIVWGCGEWQATIPF
jgi:hypothetical protein